MPRPVTAPATSEAARGTVECQVCGCEKSVEEAIALWRDDAVVFAVCHQCTRAHDIVMRPSGNGVEVLAKSRGGRPIPARARNARPQAVEELAAPVSGIVRVA